ncbi:choice-of-anchor J domain-containing protein [Empedobacter tilapiae]
MKKILFSLLTLSSISTLSAQIFQEDFDGNGPGISAWTVIDNDKNTPASAMSFIKNGWNSIDRLGANGNYGGPAGNYSAMSTSWYNPAGTSDDWLISPVIDLKDTKAPVIEWNAKAQDPEFSDGYKVMISTGGNTIEDFKTELLSISSENGDWTKRTIDLKEYIGKQIRIAFVNNSTDMFMLLIDDIKVNDSTDPQPTGDVIWSDNFDDKDISDWKLYDKDGDGYKWSAVQSTDENGIPVGSPLITSASFINNVGPLTPDNWITSPQIDLTNVDGQATLKYGVFASDPKYNKENYAVYISTTNDTSNEAAFKQVFTEKDLPGKEAQRSVDLTEFVGQKIYITFRHFNVTDMYRINIDNVSVEGKLKTLATSDINTKQVTNVYPNPVEDSFKIDLGTTLNKANVTIELYDMVGKKVQSFDYADSYNISSLPKGVYVLKINDGATKVVKKIVKK